MPHMVKAIAKIYSADKPWNNSNVITNLSVVQWDLPSIHSWFIHCMVLPCNLVLCPLLSSGRFVLVLSFVFLSLQLEIIKRCSMQHHNHIDPNSKRKSASKNVATKKRIYFEANLECGIIVSGKDELSLLPFCLLCSRLLAMNQWIKATVVWYQGWCWTDQAPLFPSCQTNWFTKRKRSIL